MRTLWQLTIGTAALTTVLLLGQETAYAMAGLGVAYVASKPLIGGMAGAWVAGTLWSQHGQPGLPWSLPESRNRVSTALPALVFGVW